MGGLYPTGGLVVASRQEKPIRPSSSQLWGMGQAEAHPGVGPEKGLAELFTGIPLSGKQPMALGIEVGTKTGKVQACFRDPPLKGDYVEALLQSLLEDGPHVIHPEAQGLHPLQGNPHALQNAPADGGGEVLDRF